MNAFHWIRKEAWLGLRTRFWMSQPNHAKKWMALGRCLVQWGDHNFAGKVFFKTLGLTPQDFIRSKELHLLLPCLVASGRMEEAASLTRQLRQESWKAFRSSPWFLWNDVIDLHALWKAGRYESALALAEQAAEDYESDVAYFYLARAFWKRGLSAQTIEIHLALADKAPTLGWRVRSHVELMKIYHELKKWTLLKDHYGELKKVKKRISMPLFQHSFKLARRLMRFYSGSGPIPRSSL